MTRVTVVRISLSPPRRPIYVFKPILTEDGFLFHDVELLKYNPRGYNNLFPREFEVHEG